MSAAVSAALEATSKFNLDVKLGKLLDVRRSSAMRALATRQYLNAGQPWCTATIPTNVEQFVSAYVRTNFIRHKSSKAPRTSKSNFNQLLSVVSKQIAVTDASVWSSVRVLHSYRVEVTAVDEIWKLRNSMKLIKIRTWLVFLFLIFRKEKDELFVSSFENFRIALLRVKN